MKSSPHLSRSLDRRSGVPQSSAASADRLPRPGHVTGSSALLGACRGAPASAGTASRHSGSPKRRLCCRRVPGRVGAFTIGEEFLMIAGADGGAPRGGMDRSTPAVGRRHASPQIRADVAETLKRWRPRGSRGANSETVSVAVPCARGWVAYTAPGSRIQARLTVLATDRRPRPD